MLVKKRKKYLILPFKSIFFKNCSVSFEELRRGQTLDLFFGVESLECVVVGTGSSSEMKILKDCVEIVSRI